VALALAVLVAAAPVAAESGQSEAAPPPEAVAQSSPVESGAPASVVRAPAAPARKFRFAPGGGAPIPWPSHYRRHHWVDGALLAGFGTAAVTAALLGPKAQGLTGGWWFDEDVRDALLPESYEAQLLARNLSDVLLTLGVSYAFIGDPLVNATWLRKSPDTGRQLGLMNLEVLAITLGIQQVAANAISRERPYGRTCGTEFLDERTIDCEGDDLNRSHFSGHTATTFAVASVTCMHHTHLPLSGEAAWIPCTVGYASATATAVLRVVGDKHYATDVIAGALAGSLIGLAVPFFHYHTGSAPLGARLGDVQLGLLPQPFGLTVYGAMP
jgi:membrane-associated phospholipid phosphatase